MVAANDDDVVVDVRDLTKHYPISRGILFKKQVGEVRAVDGVDLQLRRGETVALVGESGCGKSTLGKLLLGLEQPTAGSIRILGDELTDLSAKQLRNKRRDIQIVLQDPYTSLNPRMNVGSIIGEPFDIHPEALAGRSKSEAVRELLDRVGLDAEMIGRYPHQFSGGQRQRIGVARALALQPQIIIADEPVSALDVSVQAQVMNLLLDLQQQFGLSYVFVSHDLAVVRQIADRVAVMYLGRIAETGAAAQVYSAPAHPYTVALLSAAPIPNPEVQASRERIELPGDPPDPINPPSGCRFRTRCWKAQAICSDQEPELRSVGSDHAVACHFPELPAR